MKVSGFTFIRNGEQLGYPFLQSISSALPIVDEFIIAVGQSEDNTLKILRSINDPKIKIIETEWNPHIRTKGFILAQQKMLAQYACTGDWALYIEGDELIHEADYPKIQYAMQKYLKNPKIEALVFDYLHFYGNTNTIIWSPSRYRRAARIIKTSVRNFAPDGLYWTVLIDTKKTRYPFAALTHAKMYHYGYVRQTSQMQLKSEQISYFYRHSPNEAFNYGEVDAATLHLYNGTHPAPLSNFFPQEQGIFKANPSYHLTSRERKNRWGLKLENLLKKDFSRKHFKLILKADRNNVYSLKNATQEESI